MKTHISKLLLVALGVALIASTVKAVDVFPLTISGTIAFQNEKDLVDGNTLDSVGTTALTGPEMINLALGTTNITGKLPTSFILAMVSDCTSNTAKLVVYDKVGLSNVVDIADIDLTVDPDVIIDTTKEINCTGTGTNKTCDVVPTTELVLVDVFLNSVGTQDSFIDGGVLHLVVKTTTDADGCITKALATSATGGMTLGFIDKKGNVTGPADVIITRISLTTGRKL